MALVMLQSYNDGKYSIHALIDLKEYRISNQHIHPFAVMEDYDPIHNTYSAKWTFATLIDAITFIYQILINDQNHVEMGCVDG